MVDNSYTIEFVDPNKQPIVVLPDTVDGPTGISRLTDIDLVGLGSSLWGEKILENIMHILENFSSEEDGNTGTPIQTNPFSPITPVQGQFWYNQSRGQLNIWDGGWKPFTGITFAAAAPASAVDGEFWWDTTLSERNLKLLVSGTWIRIVDDYLLRDGDSMTGTLNMGNNKITNVADPDPFELQDVMTLNFAEQQYVNVTGDSMSGTLDMGTNLVTNVVDPSNLQDAMTRNFADNNYLNIAGGIMTGVLDMGSNKITTTSVGTNDEDVVNVKYVTDNMPTIDNVWPVDSIYISISPNNPSTFLGGTWVAFAQGQMLVGTDTRITANPLFVPGALPGGDANAVAIWHKHTTTANGNHNHIGGAPHDNNGAQYGYINGNGMLQSHKNQWTVYRHPYTSTTGSHSHTVNPSGEPGTNLNLPPYIVTYMWKRTG